jgi:hypothetical protein
MGVITNTDRPACFFSAVADHSNHSGGRHLAGVGKGCAPMVGNARSQAGAGFDKPRARRG